MLTVVGALVATGGAAQPGEQPATFRFIVNAGTVKAPGLGLAPAVRARADKVIE